MGYALITPPASEPVSLAEAKLQINIDATDTYTDSLILAQIVAARVAAEQITKRSLITQTWRYVMDSFPGQTISSVPWGREFSIPNNAVLLEKGPVVAVTSITYTDTQGAQQTMPVADYFAELSGPAARVTPVFGKVWPITLPQIGSAVINFTAGYGGAASVPQGIKQWMLLRIGSMFENREGIVVGRGITTNELSFSDSLLDPYRIEIA